ncbi:MAG: hypothetical protein ACFFBI_14310 [Promethearchaeota archaeon]
MKELVMLHQIKRSNWYKPWNRRSVGLNLIGFMIIAILTLIFTIFFDIIMIKIGYIYLYFVMIFLMMITYFFITYLKTIGTAVFFFGINGIIGIPIELILEWQMENTLKSPWSAIYWALIYIAYGLSIDLSMWLLKPANNERRAVLISSFISSVMFIILSIVALTTFYKKSLSISEIDDFLTYGYFLIPYSIIQGVMGGFIGWYLADYLLERRHYIKSPNQINNVKNTKKRGDKNYE